MHTSRSSDGSAITVTADHPFWVDAGHMLLRPGSLPAGHRCSGDHLCTASGVDAVVTGLRYNVGHAAVYTLTVARDHTFFVGTVQGRVHNAQGCGMAARIPDLSGKTRAEADALLRSQVATVVTG
jgi:hypothetical protein